MLIEIINLDVFVCNTYYSRYFLNTKDIQDLLPMLIYEPIAKG